MSMHHMSAVLMKPEQGVGYPETGVTQSCNLSCESWGINPGSFKRQSVILTTEPSLQSQKLPFCN